MPAVYQPAPRSRAGSDRHTAVSDLAVKIDFRLSARRKTSSVTFDIDLAGRKSGSVSRGGNRPVQVEAALQRCRLFVAEISTLSHPLVRNLLVVAPILVLCQTSSIGAETEGDRSQRIPKIEEGKPAPWLEYYRRERGGNWPSAAPNAGGQPDDGIIAPSVESGTLAPATGNARTAPVRDPAKPPSSLDAQTPH